MRTLLWIASSTIALAQAPLTLTDLEKLALERNPTIAQAQADIRAAAGRVRQAGLYPNPTVAVVGDEISAKPTINGGEIGGGFEQRIVTGGKLGLSKQVAQREQQVAETAASAQNLRVLNEVRRLFYQALGDQFRLQVRGRLAELASEASRITDELANIGQADQPDQLAATVEAERIELELVDARNRQERTWRQLGALLNDPTLKPVPLAGDLEQVPRLDAEQALNTILEQSPEVRVAEIRVGQAETALKREKREVIPDVIMSGGVRYNRELLSTPLLNSPIGKEGFFDIGIQLPIFNRNQGNVAAAQAGLDRARLEVNRTKLTLRSNLAEVYRDYQTALTRADRYKTEILPKAQRAYDLYISNFRQLAAAYPQALLAQRNLFALQDAYVDALNTVWTRSVEIQGLLLSGGLEMAH